MGNQPIEKLLKAAKDSRYKLVILASMRSTELAEGLPPLVDGVIGEKPTVVALKEIIDGKIEYKLSDGKKAKEEKVEDKKEPKKETKKETKKESKKEDKKKK